MQQRDQKWRDGELIEEDSEEQFEWLPDKVLIDQMSPSYLFGCTE